MATTKYKKYLRDQVYAHQLTNEIMHQTNQPLMATMAYLEGCLHYLKDSTLPNDVLHALQQAISQTQRAGDIVHSFNHYYANYDQTYTVIQASTLLTSIIKDIKEEAQLHGVKLHYHSELSKAKLNIHEQKIECALSKVLLHCMHTLKSHSKTNRSEIMIKAISSGQVLNINITATVDSTSNRHHFKLFNKNDIELSIAKYIITSADGTLSLNQTKHQLDISLPLWMESTT